ncbi:MAG: hypothetical protein WCR36_06670 [Bacteroidaceae bacterium]
MNKYSIILFYGALWGFIETTVGYTSHLFHLHIANLILFPIGLACMLIATKRLDFKIYVPVAVGLLTALFKLTNFVIPVGGDFHHVINPIVSIISEGCFISVAVWILKLEKYKITFRGIILLYIFSMLFSLLFMSYQLYIGMRVFSYLLSANYLAGKFGYITYHIALFYIGTSLISKLSTITTKEKGSRFIETYLAIPTTLLALTASLLFM